MSAGVVHRPRRDVEPVDVLRRRNGRCAGPRRAGAGSGSCSTPVRTPRTAVTTRWPWRCRARGRTARSPCGTGRSSAGGRCGQRRRGGVALGPAGLRVLGHDRCAGLAEATGLILPLGEWVLRVAGGQSVWWRQRGQFDRPLAVRLTAHQSSDADLVSRVVGMLDQTGLTADRSDDQRARPRCCRWPTRPTTSRCWPGWACYWRSTTSGSGRWIRPLRPTCRCRSVRVARGLVETPVAVRGGAAAVVAGARA